MMTPQDQLLNRLMQIARTEKLPTVEAEQLVLAATIEYLSASPVLLFSSLLRPLYSLQDRIASGIHRSGVKYRERHLRNGARAVVKVLIGENIPAKICGGQYRRHHDICRLAGWPVTASDVSNLRRIAFHHIAIVINDTPKVMLLADNLYKNLIEVPSPVRVTPYSVIRFLRISDADMGPDQFHQNGWFRGSH